ncbi:MAG: hypothetical protein JO056_07075 [Alphaproteobacteria bacterium]|nr:hypothetical protein [Alphaproteobacteria bacterium]
MKNEQIARIAGILLTAAAGIAIGSQANAKAIVLTSGPDANGAVAATLNVPQAGGKGWQGFFTYNVPTGTTALFFHYPCPAGLTPVSGGINPNSPASTGMRLLGNYNRGNGEWGWLTSWDSGAAAGSQIGYDVYCSKK